MVFILNLFGKKEEPVIVTLTKDEINEAVSDVNAETTNKSCRSSRPTSIDYGYSTKECKGFLLRSTKIPGKTIDVCSICHSAIGYSGKPPP